MRVVHVCSLMHFLSFCVSRMRAFGHLLRGQRLSSFPFLGFFLPFRRLSIHRSYLQGERDHRFCRVHDVLIFPQINFETSL